MHFLALGLIIYFILVSLVLNLHHCITLVTLYITFFMCPIVKGMRASSFFVITHTNQMTQ